MKIRILSFVLLFVFFATNAATSVKLNPEQGKTYSVIIKVENVTSMNMNGMQMDMTNTMTSKMSVSLISKTADFLVVKVSFDSIVNEMNMPGRNMVMSSLKPGNPKNPEESMNTAFYIMSQNPLEVKMKSNGKVLEVTNAKTVSAEIMKALDSLPQVSQMQMKPMLEMTAGEASLKSMVESIFFYLPENNETDSWTNKNIYAAQGMSLEVKGDFKVKKQAGNEITISGETTIEPAGDGKMKMNGMEFTFEMRGMGNGDIVVDEQTGFILKGKSKQRMQGNINANGQVIPMQIESKTEYNKVN